MNYIMFLFEAEYSICVVCMFIVSSNNVTMLRVTYLDTVHGITFEMGGLVYCFSAKSLFPV